MTTLFLFILMIYSGWRALVNYMAFSEVQKMYGSLPVRGPDYGLRAWLWILVFFIASLGLGIPIFSGNCRYC